MGVATASKEAYGRMRTVDAKEHPVYKFLKSAGVGSDGYSNRQIAAIMGRPINTITPRVFELRGAGVVVLAGKRKDLYSGIEVSHWRIATEAEEASFKRMTTIPELAPRTWLHLYEVPDGATVVELDGTRWINEGGKFKMSSHNGIGWSSPIPLSGSEKFYGPVTEVVVTATDSTEAL